MKKYLNHELIAHASDYNKYKCIKCEKYIYNNSNYPELYYCVNNLTGHIMYKLSLTCEEEIIKGIIE